ncbi:hypothetical protein GQ44DRAFT_777344 [Phaeosphaeriaceae sp. PMI808]|nr:hypothetical protein GQ44DRAFT_777344 [Phaeosphaeriaceae sp. PMI808]
MPAQRFTSLPPKLDVRNTLAAQRFTSSPPELTPRKQLDGTCPSTNLPTEAQYTIAYNQFCTTYFPAPPESTTIKYSHDIVATFQLKTHDNSIAPWIFKVEATQVSIIPLTVDQVSCKAAFKEVVEGLPEGGWGPGLGLGKSYCVVAGTGGDLVGTEGMSGQGNVGILGASMEKQKNYLGSLFFETRRKNGT